MLKQTKKTGVHLVVATMIAFGLAACGGGGGGSTVSSTGTTTTGTGTTTTSPSAGATTPVGQTFQARLAPKVWHSLSSSANGQVLVAGENDNSSATSPLHISTDGGQTWKDAATSSGTSLSGSWISSDVSDDGKIIFAVQYNGNMYRSTDSGVTFSQVTSTSVTLTSRLFEGVTVSQDGKHVAAAIRNDGPTAGAIVLSDDSGLTWRLANGPTASGWRSIDNSIDGKVIIAVAEDPAVFISRDGGNKWDPLTVSVSNAPVTSQHWYRVKLSADGRAIAMVANSFGVYVGAPSYYDVNARGNGIYVSRDGGTSFLKGNDLVGDYSALGMSADGQVIAATVSNGNATGSTQTGTVLWSKNSGTTFDTLAITGATDTNWRAITVSGDATTIAVAAGSFLTGAKGQLFTSTGSRP